MDKIPNHGSWVTRNVSDQHTTGISSFTTAGFDLAAASSPILAATRVHKDKKETLYDTSAVKQ